MQTLIKSLFTFFIVFALSYLEAHSTHAQPIYFDETKPDVIVVGNDFYEVAFLKTNGAITYIMDKATGQHISEGSRFKCLWGATGPFGYLGGCSYSNTGANHFQYSWSADTHTLWLNYAPAPVATQRMKVQVQVQFSATNVFDLHLQLQNERGKVVDAVHFPSDLVFHEQTLQQVLVPALPGVVLEPVFFTQKRSYIAKYPGSLFADYIALAATNGQFSLYSLYGDGAIQPLILGFNHDDQFLPATTFYSHAFAASVDAGNTWTTPWIRIRIGQTLAETINAFRLDNHLDNLRSLPAKLGSSYEQVAQSPLYKADAIALAVPFSQYPALLARVPTPGILHPVMFQPRVHGENYPDFLPPAPVWGTTAQMNTMFHQAQAQGFWVMPYINPTWWDKQSPTLQNLDPGIVITDVVVADQPNKLYSETYGNESGYVVSPAAPFVQQRLKQLFASLTTDLPSNMVFEDQIGARPWIFDYNRFSPTPTDYAQGWVDHTRAYSNTLLMTENGFDRLAETEVGFHGSVLLSERVDGTKLLWGDNDWHVYPLAPLLVRDKVLFYQHDLAPETFTHDKTTLAWNMAMGYMLSYDLYPSGFGGGVDSVWLTVVSDFQKIVISRYAQERMLHYINLQPQVTQTTFEHFNVVTNWSTTQTYPMPLYSLAPSGFIVTATDQSLVAGLFTRYNDQPLSTGEHYLIEDRQPGAILVRQPSGPDTDLTIALPAAWHMSKEANVQVFASPDQLIAQFPAAVNAGKVSFSWQRQRAERTVGYYKLVKP